MQISYYAESDLSDFFPSFLPSLSPCSSAFSLILLSIFTGFLTGGSLCMARRQGMLVWLLYCFPTDKTVYSVLSVSIRHEGLDISYLTPLFPCLPYSFMDS